MTSQDQDQAVQFDLAKYNGTITITSSESGEHRTFRIRTNAADSKFAPNARVISLLSGPDNTSDYQHFGFVNTREDGSAWVYVWKTKGDKFQAYGRMFGNLARLENLGKIHIQASVRCRRCNRKLTDPTSIDLGIGPICRGEQ